MLLDMLPPVSQASLSPAARPPFLLLPPHSVLRGCCPTAAWWWTAHAMRRPTTSR